MDAVLALGVGAFLCGLGIGGVFASSYVRKMRALLAQECAANKARAAQLEDEVQTIMARTSAAFADLSETSAHWQRTALTWRSCAVDLLQKINPKGAHVARNLIAAVEAEHVLKRAAAMAGVVPAAGQGGKPE